MKILSIETSCDDTGITILEVRPAPKRAGQGRISFRVLADALAIQNIHAAYGGVFPMMAKREHIKNLPILLEQVLKKTKLNKKAKPVDAIAVTYGPGLEPCLWTGIVLAQELAKKWNVPVIPVNHMEGHILSVFGKNKGKFSIPKIHPAQSKASGGARFPILSLLVSGGHTELVLIKDWGKYEIIGRTVDDAAGEAFDKVARMLGLPYPGGAHISKLAEQERKKSSTDTFVQVLGSPGPLPRPDRSQKHAVSASRFSLPRPMLHSKNFNFSYSGLKTAVLYFIRDHKNFSKSAIALEFENAVVDTLLYKTQKAMEKYKAKTLIVGGGVAANTHLRKQLKKLLGKDTKIYFPTKELARDNAVMIGMAGYMNFLKKKGKLPKPASIKATGNLRL